MIRTVKWKAPKENGMHRTYWAMGEKGVKGMRRGEPRGNREPRGVTVLPGTYKLRLSFGDQKDSTEVEVKYDPRIDMSQSAIQAKYDALKSLESKADLGYQAVERLKESIKVAEGKQGDLKKKDKEGFKDQFKLCKDAIDTLNSMLDIFLGEEDDRQGITRRNTESINNHYFSAFRYVSNALHAPGDTENKLITKFEAELAEALETVNGYYSEEWPKFREAVETLDTSPFKDYDDIK